MNLQDFNTLTEAQNYTETGTKMISPDMMVAFLTQFGLMILVETGTSNEMRGLRKALDFGSEFNFMVGHPANIIALVDVMVQNGEFSSQFRDFCISYANPVTKPFENVTQEEFDAAKAKEAAKGTTLATNIFYNGLDSIAAGHFVNIGQFRQLKFAPIFTTNPSFDYLVEVTIESEGSTPNTWVEEGIITLQGKANTTPKWTTITNSYKARRFRVKEAKINLANTDFTLDVLGV